MAKTTTLGKDVQRLAAYLMTGPHANMIGLYFLPTLYICEEVGIDPEAARLALQELQTLEFSFYDQETEHVWVKEMARFQIGVQLNEKDGNVGAIRKLYQNLPLNPWLGPFFDRYASAFHLHTRRAPAGPALEGGAPWGGLEAPHSDRVGSVPVPVPVPVRISGGPVDNFTQAPPAPPEPPTLQLVPPDPPAPKPVPNPEHATPEWIRERWNQIPGVEPFQGKLEGGILERIKAALNERKSKAWWLDYFEKVQPCDWMCGRNEKGWAASLFWALGPINIKKLLAGQFPNRRAPAAPLTNGTPAKPAPGCNYYPELQCSLPVTSTQGNERRCVWHNYLARNPELHEDRETFAQFWPTVHTGVRRGLTVEQAWIKTTRRPLAAIE